MSWNGTRPARAPGPATVRDGASRSARFAVGSRHRPSIVAPTQRPGLRCRRPDRRSGPPPSTSTVSWPRSAIAGLSERDPAVCRQGPRRPARAERHRPRGRPWRRRARRVRCPAQAVERARGAAHPRQGRRQAAVAASPAVTAPSALTVQASGPPTRSCSRDSWSTSQWTTAERKRGPWPSPATTRSSGRIHAVIIGLFPGRSKR